MILDEVKNIYNQGVSLLNKNNYKKALPLFKEVIKRYPCKEGYTNAGNCYRGLGQDKFMFSSYREALNPSVPFLDNTSKTDLHAMNNLGLAHYMYGNDDKAIEIYRQAIKLDPEFWEAWWNCSTALLRKASSGSTDLFPVAWEAYKARFLKSGAIKLKNTREDLVYWDTISGGPAIVVLAEQGIGDNIMFGRYLPLLAKKFDRVYVQCDPSLHSVFSSYTCVWDAADIVGEDNLVAYPICSLGECFPSIPSADWLKGKYGTREFNKERLNVGIVWAGSPTHANNAYRSVPITRFNGLSKFCNLYALSPNFKSTKHVRSLDIKTWEDTAECINGLDLIIGVDTSVMHMCGSLGRPGLLLQPYKETDFRWGNGVDYSVWYPTIKIISNPQSWEVVFGKVADELSSMC